MYDKLNNIKEYFQSMELIEGKWVICVKYKPKWGAYPSEDNTINAVPDEKVPDVYWYFPKSDKVGIDEIIALIEETIQTNLDAVKKAELFKEKAIELKKLFSDESISFNTLKTLKFVMDEEATPVVVKKKTAKKAKPKSKKEIMAQAVDEAEETPIDYTKSKQGDIVKIDGNDTMLLSAKEPVNGALLASNEVMNATDMSQDEIDDLRG